MWGEGGGLAFSKAGENPSTGYLKFTHFSENRHFQPPAAFPSGITVDAAVSNISRLLSVFPRRRQPQRTPGNPSGAEEINKEQVECCSNSEIVIILYRLI